MLDSKLSVIMKSSLAWITFIVVLLSSPNIGHLVAASSQATHTVIATTSTQTSTTTQITSSITSVTVRVFFIDVGQGDSIFIDTPGDDLLIDGGPRTAGSKVVQFLTDLGVNRLDYVIATHPHSDHIGGLITLFQSNIEIGNILWNGESRQTATYEEWYSLAAQHSMVKTARGQNYTLANGVWMLVLNPTQPLEFAETNENSVVVKIQVGKTGFMLTGDCEQQCEASIISSGNELESEA
ncbi:MAG: MBL fold metallo-hydrolase, partial [Thaumarchaeota archaeon]|nr:MBL fold metallo-hydrolase [Nitrososphaerota archaeon]